MQNKPSRTSTLSAVGTHIYLIGMMGSGKSFWAQKIAAANGMDWIDLDAQVEKAMMMTVKEIFESEGEDFFRRKEKEALHNLSHLKNIIIASGGGTPCFYDNMQWMNEHGITVWLDEPVETLVERLKPGKKYRPLLKDLNDDKMKKCLEKILKERRHFYAQAKYHLNGRNISKKSFSEISNNHIHV